MTDAGVRMTVDQLVETCDFRDLFLQVMDFHGRSLFLGRSRRLGSVDQYLAPVGEEGGKFRTDPRRWQTIPPPKGCPDRVLWIPPEQVDPSRAPTITVHPASWTTPGQVLRRQSQTLLGLLTPARPTGWPPTRPHCLSVTVCPTDNRGRRRLPSGDRPAAHSHARSRKRPFTTPGSALRSGSGDPEWRPAVSP